MVFLLRLETFQRIQPPIDLNSDGMAVLFFTTNHSLEVLAINLDEMEICYVTL